MWVSLMVFAVRFGSRHAAYGFGLVQVLEVSYQSHLVSHSVHPDLLVDPCGISTFGPSGVVYRHSTSVQGAHKDQFKSNVSRIFVPIQRVFLVLKELVLGMSFLEQGHSMVSLHFPVRFTPSFEFKQYPRVSKLYHVLFTRKGSLNERNIE